MTNQEKASRGLRARLLDEDPLFAEAFATLEASYIAAWRTCADRKGRGLLWVYVNNLGKVREHIRKVIADGRLAESDIRNLEKGIMS